MDEDLAEINVTAGELRGKLEALDRSVCGMFPATDPFHLTHCHCYVTVILSLLQPAIAFPP